MLLIIDLSTIILSLKGIWANPVVVIVVIVVVDIAAGRDAKIYNARPKIFIAFQLFSTL